MSGAASATALAVGDAVSSATIGSMVADGLVGSAIGAGISGITGGNVGQGALMGGLGSAGGSLLGSALGGAGAGFSGITGSNIDSALGTSIFGDGASTAADMAAANAANSTLAGSGTQFSSLTGQPNLMDPSSLSGTAASSVSPQAAAALANNAATNTGGGLLSGASGLLGKNPLQTLGILAQAGNSIYQSQQNQDALKKAQAQNQAFNQTLSNTVNNFTPLNRTMNQTPTSVGNLNNYGQAGYTGWNGQGGNQLFYNNVNPGFTSAMKAGGKVKGYAGGGEADTTDQQQKFYEQQFQQAMASLAGNQGQSPRMPSISGYHYTPMRDDPKILAAAMNTMAQNAAPAVSVRPNEPLATQLSNQIYPHQEPSLASGGYAKGGRVHPKVKGIQVSKTTQVTIPQGGLPDMGQNPLGQIPQGIPQQPQGIPQQPQGLAFGGRPKIMDRIARPSRLPMEPMPNRIPTSTTGMMLNRLNPDNPHLNLSPLRMMAKGGYLSGDANGQADTVPAKLSEGEYVLPADVVSHLGGGNNNAGAKVVDGMVKNIRVHQNVNPKGVKGAKGKLPPKAKPIVEYIKHRKVSK